jgi:hypothetical protein
MNTNTNLSEVLDKCRKLSRLSASSNSNEAALAASKLADIMMKYQISEIELEHDENRSKPVNEHLFYESNRKSHWRMNISAGCARLFNCLPYWYGGNICMIGREEDVNLSRYLFDMITPQIESLCDKSWNAHYICTMLEYDMEIPEPVTHPSFNFERYQSELESRKSFTASFLLSCSRVVKTRLMEKYNQSMTTLEQDNKSHTQSHALTVMNNRRDAVMKYAKSMRWSRARLNSPTSSSIVGELSGAKAGQKVRIDKAIISNLTLLKG